jgi:ADP-ribose pyrophosphatase YjhB (NUDIX family)
MRVGDGILGVRRGIQPKKGHLALPGGFHNFGELWQRAIVRELEEETGVVVPEGEVQLFDALTSTDGRHHLTFGTVSSHLSELPELVQTPNPVTGESETEELVILKGDETLAFPLHTEALHKYAAMLRLLNARRSSSGLVM